MMSGGSEATISPIGIEGFTSCKALSTNNNENPTKASRPFDNDRDGFVMGEGSSILILEIIVSHILVLMYTLTFFFDKEIDRSF